MVAAIVAAVVYLPAISRAADSNRSDNEVRRIDQRYAVESVTETPDFRQEIVPLLSKLGCNGRACHGSFQGRGGFRLSLFGYDFLDRKQRRQAERQQIGG